MHRTRPHHETRGARRSAGAYAEIDPGVIEIEGLGNRRTVAAGLLQATSLSFVVAAVQIGTLPGEISVATGAALIGAGLLSVMLFPLLALMLLGDREQSETDTNDDTSGVKRAGSYLFLRYAFATKETTT